ncbi:MAG: hypothetical protein ACI3ZQ_10755 [Candidatus Cryptobacteroides sp.]
MKNTKTALSYITPGMTVLNMQSEQAVMAGSNNWYNKGGEGDFDYGISTDDEWA